MHPKSTTPDTPTIPFIRGDGSGADIWAAASMVIDAAVEKAFQGTRKIEWLEVFAGETAFKKFGTWLPDETLNAFREYKVGIKGPLTTPVGKGERSLNVRLRQALDLYVCMRPVKYFSGIETPVKHPEKIDMVVFRENTEDIYAGIDWPAGSTKALSALEVLKTQFPEDFEKIRFGKETPNEIGIGVKPISKSGTQRLIRAAIEYAIARKRKSLTIVHKGNIMKSTEGAFRDWGYELAKNEFGAEPTEKGTTLQIPYGDNHPQHFFAAGHKPSSVSDAVAGRFSLSHSARREPLAVWREAHASGLVIKDCICDAFLQEILLHPEEYDVIAAPNLNGDYISDALAAQVGGIGISPGANINCKSGHAIFEATHGTAPTLAGKDMANPSSLLLSAEMMLRHIGWDPAADLIVKGIEGAIAAKTVTFDLAEMIPGAKTLRCSEFARAVIEHM